MADLCVCEGLFLAQPLLRMKESLYGCRGEGLYQVPAPPVGPFLSIKESASENASIRQVCRDGLHNPKYCTNSGREASSLLSRVLTGCNLTC